MRCSLFLHTEFSHGAYNNRRTVQRSKMMYAVGGECRPTHLKTESGRENIEMSSATLASRNWKWIQPTCKKFDHSNSSTFIKTYKTILSKKYSTPKKVLNLTTKRQELKHDRGVGRRSAKRCREERVRKQLHKVEEWMSWAVPVHKKRKWVGRTHSNRKILWREKVNYCHYYSADMEHF